LPETNPKGRQVLVCQNRTCRKQGSEQVLAAFQSQSGSSEIVASGCLGQCGNGPMVLVQPDQVWYCRLQPDEVPTVVTRHLQGGEPVRGMLYSKVHPR